MSLDLNKLENKLDEALSNETSQTLTKFLNDKRMTNNKQQTAVDSIIEFCQKQMDNDSSIHKGVYLSIIKFCKEQITEESSYSDGYKEGFQRALKLSNLVVKNLIPTDNDKQ